MFWEKEKEKRLTCWAEIKVAPKKLHQVRVLMDILLYQSSLSVCLSVWVLQPHQHCYEHAKLVSLPTGNVYWAGLVLQAVNQ